MDIEDNEFFDKIRKIKLLNEILIAWGRDKILLKALDEAQKHYTMRVTENGTLDFHETIEGTKKQYPRTGKILLENMKKLAYELRKTLIKNLPKTLEEINIGDSKYKDVKVLIIPDKKSSRKLFLQALKIEGKKGLVDENAMMSLIEKFGRVSMSDLQNYDFKHGYILEDEKSESFLYQIGGRYFILRLSHLKNLGEKLVEKFMILQRNNGKKAQKRNARVHP